MNKKENKGIFTIIPMNYGKPIKNVMLVFDGCERITKFTDLYPSGNTSTVLVKPKTVKLIVADKLGISTRVAMIKHLDVDELIIQDKDYSLKELGKLLNFEKGWETNIIRELAKLQVPELTSFDYRVENMDGTSGLLIINIGEINGKPLPEVGLVLTLKTKETKEYYGSRHPISIEDDGGYVLVVDHLSDEFRPQDLHKEVYEKVVELAR